MDPGRGGPRLSARGRTRIFRTTSSWALPPPNLAFGADELAEQLRALFRLWVTELRPVARQGVPGCAQSLLRRLRVRVGRRRRVAAAGPASAPPGRPSGLWALRAATRCCSPRSTCRWSKHLDGSLVVADGGWRVDESERPYLLHTRLLQEWLLTGVTGCRLFDSPPSGGASGPPIAAVTASQVTGPPTATWDSTTRTLDLGIPAGAGVDSVVVTQSAGLPPAVVSFTGGVSLGLANGKDGSPGPGIAQVNAVGLPSGSRADRDLVGPSADAASQGDPGPSGTLAGPGGS